MIVAEPLRYTTETPKTDGLYWEKSIYGVSVPYISFRGPEDEYQEGDNKPLAYREPGKWLFAGPMQMPSASDFVVGIPTKPGCYLESTRTPEGNRWLPFMILPDRPLAYTSEMTYYGPFPEPTE